MIIVFDTDCVLCSAWVHFVLRNEQDNTTCFVSAWSEEGAALAGQHGLTVQELDTTYLVVSEGQGLTHSDAGLAITRKLRWPWRALAVFAVVPRPVRDWVYSVVARNRYRWFGHAKGCFLPPEADTHRFVNGTRNADDVS